MKRHGQNATVVPFPEAEKVGTADTTGSPGTVDGGAGKKVRSFTDPLYNDGAMETVKGEVTRLLLDWSSGDGQALSRLMPLVAAELRRIAGRYWAGERIDHTLQPTALVNEVYLRLVDRKRVSWKNRAHFFGFAAQTMRRILVDHARLRRAKKRNNGVSLAPLDEARIAVEERDWELVALDDALEALASIHERQSRIIELHFFTGLNFEEIGQVLRVSSKTAKRDWRAARLWLHKEMTCSKTPTGSGFRNC